MSLYDSKLMDSAMSGQSTSVPPPPQTVKSYLDSEIDGMRERLQKLMETRAKAEFMGCLDWPMEFINKLHYPF